MTDTVKSDFSHEETIVARIQTLAARTVLEAGGKFL